jgi:PAS domain S-box-containing protein
MPARTRQTQGPPRLVLRFAVYAGAAVVLAAVGALLLARFNAASSADNDLSDDAAYIADELGRDDLAREAFDGRVNADLEAQLDDFLGRIAAARSLARASLVAPDGTVTYSTDHTLIGTQGAAFGKGMLDARVPVRWVIEARRTRGALVAEREDATVAEAVRHALLTQALLVVLALLVLYALLIPVFNRVTSALAASEQRLRSLMEQASDAIFVADDKGRLTDVNRKACELLGYTRAELLQKHAMDLITIADAAELRTGKSILVERPVRRKDGTFVVGDIAANILDDGRIRTSIRDVTERKRLREAQSSRRSAALRAASRTSSSSCSTRSHATRTSWRSDSAATWTWTRSAAPRRRAARSGRSCSPSAAARRSAPRFSSSTARSNSCGACCTTSPGSASSSCCGRARTLRRCTQTRTTSTR